MTARITSLNAHPTPVKSLILALTFTLLSLPSVALAVPDVVVNDPKTGQPLPNQPASVPVSMPTSAPSPMANPSMPTLAQANAPTDSQLSQANTKLLTENAELQRQVDSLTTQVNVLINERSGQLFMFGAFTALGSVVAGLILGGVFFGRNKGRW